MANGYPEEKTSPEPNDIERLQCLYGPKGAVPFLAQVQKAIF
jgi:hypothetical protein